MPRMPAPRAEKLVTYGRYTLAAIVTLAAVAIAAPVALGDSSAVDGPMAFNPIAGSAYSLGSSTWTEPWVIPAGFQKGPEASSATPM